MFDGETLLELLRLADYCAVNDYEGKLLAERTGRPLEELARMVRALVVTRGGAGSEIHANGRHHQIPIVDPAEVVDPTGCGDAYRAGLLYGIGNGLDWETTGRLASLMGSIKIAQRGGQNHTIARDEIAGRFRGRVSACTCCRARRPWRSCFL